METSKRRLISKESSSTSIVDKREEGVVIIKRTRKRRRVSSQHTRKSDTDVSGSSHRHGKSYRKRNKKARREGEGNRKWVFSSRDCSAYNDRFVIVSYNILGVENASKHLDLYHQVPPQMLNWDWRKKLIHEELNHYLPSILCFQEVDRFSDLADLLQEDGYKGVYKGRTGEACDGCAIFWREELFSLLHQESIEFQKFGLRDNVAQLCILKMNLNHSSSSRSNNANPQMTTPSRSLLVGNIHVLFNPNRGDIKLGQARLLLEKAHKMSQEWGNIPVVLAGDLNSMPQSAIYQFFASSELDILMHDRRKISCQIEATERSRVSISKPFRDRWTEEEIQLAAGSRGCTHLQHQLKLSSAYLGVPGSSSTRDDFGEPLATSYHSKFMGTVDYIWHSRELVPVGVVETLPCKILRKTGGLPSEQREIGYQRWSSELSWMREFSPPQLSKAPLPSQKLDGANGMLEFTKLWKPPPSRNFVPCVEPSTSYSPPTESKGYLLVHTNGGLNQMRAGCYIAPLTGSKFYSKREVFRYLKNRKFRSQTSKPEKRSIKTPSDNFVLVQIEDSPEGLPSGWIREIKFRRRPSTNEVKRDPYNTDPVTGCVFRSKKDVLRYLETGDLGKYAHRAKKTCIYDTHSLDKKYIPPNAAKRVKVSDNKPTWRLFENQSSNSDGMMTKLFNKSPTEEQHSPFTSHSSNQCEDDTEPTSLPLISPIGSKKGQRTRIQAEKQLQPVQLASGLSLKLHSRHGSAHIGADQAVEVVPGVWVRWAAKQLDRLEDESDSKKPGSPLAFPLRDSWSDPRLEFAVKMLTGEIPIKGEIQEIST